MTTSAGKAKDHERPLLARGKGYTYTRWFACYPHYRTCLQAPLDRKSWRESGLSCRRASLRMLSTWACVNFLKFVIPPSMHSLLQAVEQEPQPESVEEAWVQGIAFYFLVCWCVFFWEVEITWCFRKYTVVVCAYINWFLYFSHLGFDMEHVCKHSLIQNIEMWEVFLSKSYHLEWLNLCLCLPNLNSFILRGKTHWTGNKGGGMGSGTCIYV